MLTLNAITYIHLNKDVLFEDIHLAVSPRSKVAFIGNNGTGKSTLLKIIAGQIQPSMGTVTSDSKPYYIPQHFGQFNELTVAQALRVDHKLNALKEINEGHAAETNLALLHEDWLIEDRCKEALIYWKMGDIDLNQKLETLSGGQKTKLFLAGIAIHQPELILMDEPSNHLDEEGRTLLYSYIKSTSDTLIIVSHDRTLLNLPGTMYELSKHGIVAYGGNYDFYVEQKEIETTALTQDLKSKEKALRKAKEVEREALERKQKLDARGKKKQTKAGLPTISMNTFRNNAEKSTSRLKDVHSEKIETITREWRELREELADWSKMKMDLNSSTFIQGKRIVETKAINVKYREQPLWKQPLTFAITSGERVAIKGNNGSGKTTLIKIILGKLLPQTGVIDKVAMKSVYIDQDYTLIDSALTVYEQAQHFNDGKLQEHEIKIRLNRFLFTKDFWEQKCEVLSGGEKMRLMLCCLMISNQAPDLMVLDEPTNNLDIQNVEILVSAINNYRGTLIVVSHDVHFLKQINVMREIVLR